MADARSLLQSERATRRINHPFASYSSSGKLLCNVCNLLIKTESLWSNHVKTPQHSIRLQARKEASIAPPSKKRKADGGEDEGRKRARAIEDIAEEDEEEAEEQAEDQAEATEQAAELPATTATGTAPANSTTANGNAIPAEASLKSAAAADEDDEELTALLREFEAAKDAPSLSINSAGAVLSAAPMTAEQIAAQAREEQSTQRGRRDVEIEGEREDAARALEDEFEEMAELEDRVRKLREKREALRAGKAAESVAVDGSTDIVSEPGVNGDADIVAEGGGEEDEDEEDEEDLDDWNFGGS